MLKKILITVFVVMSQLCHAQTATDKAAEEIKAAEKAFEKMAAEKGIQEAFTFFAADNAIINRGNDSLITGKAAIQNFYAAEIYKHATLSWSPDIVNVAASGDLGYTIGKYTWTSPGNGDKPATVLKGVFHTVWKKQPNGEWKYVWD